MTTQTHVDRLAKTSRRTALVSFLSLVLIVGSIGYSAIRLSRLQVEIDEKQSIILEKQRDIDKKTVAIDSMTVEIEGLNQQLRNAIVINKNKFSLEWADAKSLASNPTTYRLVDRIFQMRQDDVPWRLRGTSPEAGFDSPSFAAYLLIKELRVLDVDFRNRYRLRELVPETDNPEIGDLVFYDTGYTMFYFKDRSGHPFCIGMTPLGIAALEINFGPTLLGYGKVQY